MGSFTSKTLSRCRPILFGLPLILAFRLAWKFRKKQIASQSTQLKLDAAITRARMDRESSFSWARSVSADLDGEELKRISAMTFEQLRDALQSGKISAETAMRVQIISALRQNDQTNSIVAFIEESIDDARRLDELAKSAEYEKPPLFGMPLSVKDAVAVNCQRCSFGLSTRLDDRCEEDSYTIARLREAGMILFCRTNVPTNCMTYNCVNGVYGRTTHPLDSRRTPGGSSGGEAALIASRGSRVGIGSDIGGSIRVPAAYAGCAGFKSSPSRMSLLQVPEPVPCRPFLVPTEGPLAETPDAIVEIMRALWSNQYFNNRDAFSIPIDFNENLFTSTGKLRIGYFLSDGYIEPLPCISRALSDAKKELERLGHELVPFSIGDIPREVYLGIASTVYTDGGAAVSHDVKEEDLTPMQDAIRQFGWMSGWQKKVLAIECRWRGEESFAELIEAMPTTAMDVQRGIDRIYASRKNLYLKMKEQNIDALLCAPTYSPATTHEFPCDPLLSVLWNGILNTMWNALDVPVGVIPFGQVSEEDEKILNDYKPSGMLEKALKEDCRDCVDLPLAVQFVAPPFRDEIVLRLMCELQKMQANIKEGVSANARG